VLTWTVVQPPGHQAFRHTFHTRLCASKPPAHGLHSRHSGCPGHRHIGERHVAITTLHGVHGKSLITDPSVGVGKGDEPALPGSRGVGELWRRGYRGTKPSKKETTCMIEDQEKDKVKQPSYRAYRSICGPACRPCISRISGKPRPWPQLVMVRMSIPGDQLSKNRQMQSWTLVRKS
jgi:hypothetical protein